MKILKPVGLASQWIELKADRSGCKYESEKVSELNLDALHAYRADKSRQRLQLYLDQPLMHPRRLRCIARAMRHATDLDVVFVQQISKVRAREAVQSHLAVHFRPRRENPVLADAGQSFHLLQRDPV